MMRFKKNVYKLNVFIYRKGCVLSAKIHCSLDPFMSSLSHHRPPVSLCLLFFLCLLVYKVGTYITESQKSWKMLFTNFPSPGGGVLNFELGTDVRPEVSTTTL